MSVDATRWEFGSFFHDVEPPELDEGSVLPWANHPHSYWSSGRGALIRGLEVLRETRGVRRLWLPSYFCPDVVQAVQSAGFAVASYPDLPVMDASTPIALEAEGGDAVLSTNHFGVRAPRATGLADCVPVIEDHSHDPSGPWARSSMATLCFASLRKSIPTVDGAVIWSPTREAIPDAVGVGAERRQSCELARAAMVAKARYLGGADVEKATFLGPLRAAELALADEGENGIAKETQARIEAFLCSTWREHRRINWRRLQQHIQGLAHVELLSPIGSGPVPFSLWLLFEQEGLRDRVRSELIAGGVYPAILWDLGERGWDGASPEAADLSRRSLSLPVDGRYTLDDMDEVARRVIQALGGG